MPHLVCTEHGRRVSYVTKIDEQGKRSVIVTHRHNNSACKPPMKIGQKVLFEMK